MHLSGAVPSYELCASGVIPAGREKKKSKSGPFLVRGGIWAGRADGPPLPVAAIRPAGALRGTMKSGVGGKQKGRPVGRRGYRSVKGFAFFPADFAFPYSSGTGARRSWESASSDGLRSRAVLRSRGGACPLWPYPSPPLSVVSRLVAAAGLLFIVPPFAVERAFGQSRAALRFLFPYLFRINLAVFRHKITSEQVFADRNRLCGASAFRLPAHRRRRVFERDQRDPIKKPNKKTPGRSFAPAFCLRFIYH